VLRLDVYEDKQLEGKYTQFLGVFR
jgi:hypothetical protein